jgi:hypothetical protein
VTGQWFSLGLPVSSTIKTDSHYITEILLKVALNTIKQTNKYNICFLEVTSQVVKLTNRDKKPVKIPKGKLNLLSRNVNVCHNADIQG